MMEIAKSPPPVEICNVKWSAIQIKDNWTMSSLVEFLECLRLYVMALKKAEFGESKTQRDENEADPWRDKLEKL